MSGFVKESSSGDSDLFIVSIEPVLKFDRNDS